MQSFSTVQLLKDLRTVIYAAVKAPVTITQHRKPRFVIMTVEDYQRLTQRDPRVAFDTRETPDDLRQFMLNQISEVLGDDDAR